MEHEIVLKPEVLGFFEFLPITNTLLVSWIVMTILIVLSVVIRLRVSIIPSYLQSVFEVIIDFIYTTAEDLAGSKRARVFFPFVATFFFFILFSNLFGLLPGVGTITFDHKPLLRSINSDLNMTLSLALLSAFLTHFFAIKYLGLKEYFKKWFSLQMFGVFLFVGFLEIVGEFTKIVSLSFRLFGNIFAGEVVLTTVSTLSKFTAFLIPLPFYFLEIIVGFVQAAVFMMLTLVFMVLLSEKHAEEHTSAKG